MNPSKDHVSYKDYVELRAQSNPCINGLERYLQQRGTRASNAVYIDYPTAKRHPPELQPITVEEDKITNLIDTLPPATTRLIIVEDISPQLISLVGNALDIDPIFFADYVNTSFENIEIAPPPPSLAILPSLLSERGHLHLHYQQVLDLGIAEKFEDAAYALKTDSNITRNIRRLTPLSGKQLALARATCSLLMKKVGSSSICLILVDRPIRSAIEGLGKQNQESYSAQHLHGGFEDVATSHRISTSTSQWNRDSMLDSLTHYLCSQGSNDMPLKILDFAYYPIRITLSEWNLYMHLISRYSKHYEYSLQDITSRLHGEDIVDLQRWRRRLKQSRHKLTLVAEFVEQNDDGKMAWKMIFKDINYLQNQFQDYGQSLEQMVTVATTMIQLLDSRRSILEAVNVRRLTYIALVFAPLAWVASLFSMEDAYLPGNDRFWIYFATALPLIAVVILFSALQWDEVIRPVKQAWKKLCGDKFILSSRIKERKPDVV
ncbi:zinc transport protein zntb [Fusarium flagelliforme]|uniref:Zinc transport protein zntb n=2 Tax=Fusarium flagelliforme TaxID=2675880 RepID=A0A395MV12_9HYPO|nr:zinc transport protein zntb [Fusarium flagelliforme]